MSLIIPVVSRHRINANSFKQVYMCPADKSHSIVDLSVYLDATVANQDISKVSVYLADKVITPNNKDYLLFKDITVGKIEVSPEFGKIVVGKKQYLFVSVDGKGPVNVRVNGLEEHNPHVVAAGQLAYKELKTIGVHEVFRVNQPMATFALGTLAISNNSTKSEFRSHIWVTDATEVKSINEAARLVDRVQYVRVEPGETVYIENMSLAPNERVYMSQSHAESMVVQYNGTVINANI